MFDVHSGVGESLTAKSFDWNSVKGDGHGALSSTPPSNRFPVDYRRDIFDVPLELFEIFGIAILQIFASFMNYRLKKSQARDAKVKELGGQGSAEPATVSVSMTSRPDSHSHIVFLGR